jgi:hypothetical protein
MNPTIATYLLITTNKLYASSINYIHLVYSIFSIFQNLIVLSREADINSYVTSHHYILNI